MPALGSQWHEKWINDLICCAKLQYAVGSFLKWKTKQNKWKALSSTGCNFYSTTRARQEHRISFFYISFQFSVNLIWCWSSTKTLISKTCRFIRHQNHVTRTLHFETIHNKIWIVNIIIDMSTKFNRNLNILLRLKF